jgi:glycerol-3-phosphate dehydrogenase subunit B
MRSPHDVGIIGGGMAGVAAALAAAAAGAAVVLIRGRPGATALSAGGWPQAPPTPVAAALATAGHRLVATPAPLPHPVGDLRAAAAAHETHAAAVVTAGACVVGVTGLPGFRPRALALLWGDAAGVGLSHARVDLPDTPAAGWSPVSLARVIEHDPASLAARLADLARETGASRLILPAVLGVDGAAEIRATLEEAAGVPVGEGLGTPPSLPGWRLWRALQRALAAAGVTTIDGVAAASRHDGDRLEAVDVASEHGDAHRVEAAAWVLATGRFVGGGVTAEPDLAEPALDTPLRLTHLGALLDALEPLAVTAADRRAPQPPLEVGVAVDADGAPIDPRTGERAWGNVVAAGAIVGGSDAAYALGAAARDGWAAGMRAASLAGGPAGRTVAAVAAAGTAAGGALATDRGTRVAAARATGIDPEAPEAGATQ